MHQVGRSPACQGDCASWRSDRSCRSTRLAFGGERPFRGRTRAASSPVCPKFRSHAAKRRWRPEGKAKRGAAAVGRKGMCASHATVGRWTCDHVSPGRAARRDTAARRSRGAAGRDPRPGRVWCEDRMCKVEVYVCAESVSEYTNDSLQQSFTRPLGAQA